LIQAIKNFFPPLSCDFAFHQSFSSTLIAFDVQKVRGKKKMVGDGTQAYDAPYAVPFNEYVLQTYKFMVNELSLLLFNSHLRVTN
jgi:hypothetical protein